MEDTVSDFVHLHCHTEYSLLDGAISISKLCDKAKDLGMQACAITDHGNMFGVAKFYKNCKEVGLKPIIGCEVYVCDNHKDKVSNKARLRSHLILLAQSDIGYHNLIKIVTCGFLEGFYYKPRVDKHILRQYSEGIICLSACIAGEIPKAILAQDMNKAKQLAQEYSSIYPNRFYIELQSNGLEEQNKVNTALLELAETCSLPIVATNDCHYLNADDADAHEVLLCIQTKDVISNEKHMKFESKELYFKSSQEMEEAFASIPEALSNSAKIAEMCNVDLNFGKHFFPVYKLPENTSLESEFRRLAIEGLEERFKTHPNPETIDKNLYNERLNLEMDVICEMGFPGYFLIVQEFINWAKNQGIPVGPGRGSAAGSLVAWALRITNLDPIPYNLLFERFLNKERISLPDIDVDFCERRRGEVIQHMVDLYGEKSVAQITTFGTMKAKAVVRDVGRALGYDYAYTDVIAKLIPNSLKMTLTIALQQEPELKKRYETEEKVKILIDTSLKLEELARHASTHAAGLVVSDKPMDEYLPLYLGKDGELVTQFDGPMTELVGLVKFDFLGLKTMTIIQDTLDTIKRKGQTPPNLDTLPLDDKETYLLYSKGDTDGVFQMESSGMRQYLRQLKPTCFEDIIAMVALYRPGPLGSGMVEEFIKRKHGQVQVSYPHKDLENCLKDTYGVIVYQEQVMQIAQIIAKYSLGKADILRRAMGKKKADVMAKERGSFVEGAVINNLSKDKANEIFDLMEKFAEYGFNKSHSAVYALISYHTAYLKVHYPKEFMAALLTSETNNQNKILKYISYCKDAGIEVIKPSINESHKEFSVVNDSIIFGLGAIKNVGDEAIKEIIETRKNGQNYTSLMDFTCRVNTKKVTKRVIESLIKSGACDCLGATRKAMLDSLEIVIARAQKKAKEGSSTQISLFSVTKQNQEPEYGVGLNIKEASSPELPDDIKMKAEKEALGFLLTFHPLQNFKREIERLQLKTIEDCFDEFTGVELKCAILITSLKEILTKRGEKMAFVEIEDLTGKAEVTFLPKIYEKCSELLKSDQPLCLTARLMQKDADDEDDNESKVFHGIKLQAIDAILLKDACLNSTKPLCIDIPENKFTKENITYLKQILEKHPGDIKIEANITIEGQKCHILFGENLTINPSPELDKELIQWTSVD